MKNTLKRRITCLILSLPILSALAACTIVNGTAIVTGNQRAPIAASEVRIYRTLPANYEEIAIVTASAGHDFRSNEGLINSTVERLKKEAAKVGANGIFLGEIDERDSPQTTTSYGTVTAWSGGNSATASGTSFGVSRGDSYTRIRGIAIFVQ